MPRLPSVVDLGGRPTPNAPSGVVSYNPAQTGGVEYEAAARAANTFQQMVSEYQDRVDKTRAEEAFNNLRNQQLELTIGDDGFKNKKGSDAVNTPLLPQYEERFAAASKSIEDSLGNENQKRMYRSRSAVALLQFKEEGLRHVAAEADVQAKQTFLGILDVETRNATVKYNEPAAIALSMKRMNDAIDSEAHRNKWDEKYTEAQKRDVAAKVNAGVIQTSLASGNIVYAKQWFDDHRENIDPNVAANLELRVADAEQKELANGYRSEFISGRDSFKVLTDLEKRISSDKVLSEDRKNALLLSVASRLDVLTNKSLMERNQQMQQLSRKLDKYEAMTLKGVELTSDQALSVIEITKGTELEEQGRALVQTSIAMNKFRLATPAVQEQMVNQLEGDVRKNPSPERVDLLNKYKTIADNQSKQIKESPVEFAFQQGLAEQVPVNLSNPEASAEGLQQQMAVARGMAARYGAPLKPLMPAQVSEATQRLKTMKTDAKLTWLGDLRKAFGDDAPAFSAAMGQIAQDDPVTAIAGDFAGKGREKQARLMLEGQALLRPNTKEDGRPDQGKLWPMPPDKDLRAEFQSIEGEAFAGSPNYRNAAYQAAVAVYAKLSQEANANEGNIDSSRFKEAMKIAVGNIDKYNGKKTILPYGMEPSDFKDGIKKRIAYLETSDRFAEGMTAGKAHDLPLEAVGDGKYLLRSGEGFILDKNNKPIVINFNEELGAVRGVIKR